MTSIKKEGAKQARPGRDKLRYTCTEYREEMILLGLQKQLARPGLSLEEKKAILGEIARVEKEMGLD